MELLIRGMKKEDSKIISDAQRLYVKRGYIPDGNGIWAQGNFIKYGTKVVMYDDVALYLSKKLRV